MKSIIKVNRIINLFLIIVEIICTVVVLFVPSIDKPTARYIVTAPIALLAINNLDFLYTMKFEKVELLTRIIFRTVLAIGFAIGGAAILSLLKSLALVKNFDLLQSLNWIFLENNLVEAKEIINNSFRHSPFIWSTVAIVLFLFDIFPLLNRLVKNKQQKENTVSLS